jgi:hypothetical protein
LRLISEPIRRQSIFIGPANADDGLILQGTLREGEGEACWLRPLIEELHRRAVERDLAQIVVDIREVEYANAAAWKCFVHWLRLAREDQAARYSLRIVANHQRKWQQLGLPALRAFGGAHLEIQVFDGDRRVV